MDDICRDDRRVIEALGAGLAGSSSPLVLASGTLFTAHQPGGRVATEHDGRAPGGFESPRAGGLELLEQIQAKGSRTIEVRFSPTTHSASLSSESR